MKSPVHSSSLFEISLALLLALGLAFGASVHSRGFLGSNDTLPKRTLEVQKD